ncbi:50S ribosomal protein L29 [bacterium]|nr:50S ribosomal protein L29 [bacterium]
MKQLEEWREMNNEELQARLNDAEEELANLNFQLGSHQLESPIKVRTARRNVARLKTLIHEKELGELKTQGSEE